MNKTLDYIFIITFLLFTLGCNKEESIDNEISFNYGSVKDQDGNTYKTITIGSQTWMAENLNVTHYTDGSEIPYIENDTTWAKLEDNNEDDGFCYYNNNENNEKDIYGALYTYAAALHACPDGWHLPSDKEWQILEDYVTQGNQIWEAGDKLKTKDGWFEEGNGSDNFGFSANPSGARNSYNGNYYDIGKRGFWRSSDEKSDLYSRSRRLSYNIPEFTSETFYKSEGYSVRCIKDSL